MPRTVSLWDEQPETGFINFRINIRDRALLDRIAERRGITRTALIRSALAEALKDERDAEVSADVAE